MLARGMAATPWGVEARPIWIEVDVRNGLPQMQIVGLPDTSVRESRERVRAAIKNCGFDLPPRAVVINLAPADVRKEGNQLDLAIALCLLAAYGVLPPDALGGTIVCGELGLDGGVRSIRGGLAIAALAASMGCREVMLPIDNAAEAAALEALPVRAVGGLAAAVEHLAGVRDLAAAIAPSTGESPPSTLDLSEVAGQEAAKRALEIAAAGGHNALFIGPPGAGKTMLARRMPGLLPPLGRAEAIEVTRIHSLAAARPPPGLLRERPFRSPHAGCSPAAMIGGGSPPRPGEVTLAHRGVLFLDELPEFRRDALEGLRQPLEEGVVTIARVKSRMLFPARFSLLAAMNPCPCGHLGDPRRDCSCTEPQVRRYRSRISGPLLDRIDLHVEVPALGLDELRATRRENSEAVRRRVLDARCRQASRNAGTGAARLNAVLPREALDSPAALAPGARRLLDRAFDRLALSVRALTRVLRVARTIADLGARDRVEAAQVAEALQYRCLDRDPAA